MPALSDPPNVELLGPNGPQQPNNSTFGAVGGNTFGAVGARWLLGAGVGSGPHFAQRVHGDQRIDLRCRHRGMTE